MGVEKMGSVVVFVFVEFAVRREDGSVGVNGTFVERGFRACAIGI